MERTTITTLEELEEDFRSLLQKMSDSGGDARFRDGEVSACSIALSKVRRRLAIERAREETAPGDEPLRGERLHEAYRDLVAGPPELVEVRGALCDDDSGRMAHRTEFGDLAVVAYSQPGGMIVEVELERVGRTVFSSRLTPEALGAYDDATLVNFHRWAERAIRHREELSAQIDRMHHRADMTAGEMQTIAEQRNELALQVVKLEEKVKHLDERLEVRVKEVEAYRHALAEKDRFLVAAGELSAKKEERIGELEEQLEKTHGVVSRLSNAVDRAAGEKKELETDLRIAHSELASLAESTNRRRDAMIAAQSRVDAATVATWNGDRPTALEKLDLAFDVLESGQGGNPAGWEKRAGRNHSEKIKPFRFVLELNERLRLAVEEIAGVRSDLRSTEEELATIRAVRKEVLEGLTVRKLTDAVRTHGVDAMVHVQIDESGGLVQRRAIDVLDMLEPPAMPLGWKREKEILDGWLSEAKTKRDELTELLRVERETSRILERRCNEKDAFVESLRTVIERSVCELPEDRGEWADTIDARTEGMEIETCRRAMQEIRVVFDGPPEAVSGRFVEVEDANGHGVNVGEWRQRDDDSGLWDLIIPRVVIAGPGDRLSSVERVLAELTHNVGHRLEALEADSSVTAGVRELGSLEDRVELLSSLLGLESTGGDGDGWFLGVVSELRGTVFARVTAVLDRLKKEEATIGRLLGVFGEGEDGSVRSSVLEGLLEKIEANAEARAETREFIDRLAEKSDRTRVELSKRLDRAAGHDDILEQRERLATLDSRAQHAETRLYRHALQIKTGLERIDGLETKVGHQEDRVVAHERELRVVCELLEIESHPDETARANIVDALGGRLDHVFELLEVDLMEGRSRRLERLEGPNVSPATITEVPARGPSETKGEG